MIKQKVIIASAVSVALLSLSGCTTIDPKKSSYLDSSVQNKINKIEEAPKVNISKKAPSNSRVVVDTKARIPLSPRKVDDTAWLSTKKVSIRISNKIVPLTEVIKSLSAQGINISSELSLDNFRYSGYSLTDAPADAALKAVLGSAGLDFSLDNKSKVVTIRPMANKTWYLNIGNRKTTYSAKGLQSGNSSSSGSSNSGSSGTSEVKSSVTSSVSAGVNAEDNFWDSLKKELDGRLTVMRPSLDNTRANSSSGTGNSQLTQSVMVPPPIPSAKEVDANGDKALESVTPQLTTLNSGPQMVLKETKIGSYSINAETGAVTVQAPHWVLNDLEPYFTRVQSMYNTDIVFEGELLVLNTTSDKSEGLDITSFGSFAKGRYGMQVRNNSLGGITVTPGDGVGVLNQNAFNYNQGFPVNASGTLSNVGAISSSSPVSGVALGITSVIDGLQVFNAYLSNLGKITTLQKPVLTTTSGIPADFKKTITKNYNTVSQQAASSNGGGAVVGTQNNLVEREFGTILRVNPRIDVATGLIRAHIELIQSSQIGTQVINQSLSGSSGNIAQVATDVPIVSQLVYSGEALLKDGDVIILGGQSEQNESTTKDGVTGLMDSPVSGLVSKANESKQKNVFYFALKVNVNKRK